MKQAKNLLTGLRRGNLTAVAPPRPPPSLRDEWLDAVEERLPARYRGLTWRLAAERAPGCKSALKALRGEYGGATLCGVTGAGKTTLAAAMLSEMSRAARGGDDDAWRSARRAWWFACHDLGSLVMRSPSWDECPQVEQALGASWLCLDDLGTEVGDRAIGEIGRIIQSRYNDQLPTVVTTALAPRVIESRYGEGVMRRLLESKMLSLGGGR